MHIPDGFLDAKVAAGTGALALLALAEAARAVRRQHGQGSAPVVGVMAAFVFAAQMLNFPIPGGTSGHLLGGALSALVLGPGMAILAMALVVVVQCFLLQDGGVSALGANTLNIAVVGVLAAYLPYRLLAGAHPGGMRMQVAVLVSVWVSVVVAAGAAAVEMALSCAVPLLIVLPAMVGVHAVIGVLEAVATAMVLVFIRRADPALLEKGGVG